MTGANGPSRRRFLLGTGVAIGTAGLAGCGIPGSGEEEGEDDEEDGDNGAENGGEDDEEEEQLQGPESE